MLLVLLSIKGYLLTLHQKQAALFNLSNFNVFNAGFPNWGQLVGEGQFGQNGQKRHKNYKIDIFGSKQ